MLTRGKSHRIEVADVSPKNMSADYKGLLRLLYDMSGKQTVSEFARLCGKQISNMSGYLNGNLNPGRKFVESCVASMFVPSIRTIMEVEQIPHRQANIPRKSGIYIIYDSGAQVLYVGKAKNFRTEVYQTLARPIPTSLRLGPKLNTKVRPTLRTLARYLSLYEIINPGFRHDAEALLLRTFVNQTHNSNIGSF
jgi:hypothetical protein